MSPRFFFNVKTLIELDQPRWLLSFDFDGTLVVPDEHPAVAPEFFELLETMRSSHKIFWGINTGRALMQTVQGLAEARFPFLPDYIVAREREIYFPNEFSRWVAVNPWNRQCDQAHHKLFRKSRRLLKRLQKWVESETAAIWGLQHGEPAGIVASTASEMEWIVKYLDLELVNTPLLSYQRNGIYLRFSHRQYHKGSAMAEVGKLIGVDSQQTFAIGDGHNDLDMLDQSLAANLACPSNACDEVKESVRLAGGCLAEGVASRGAIEAMRAMVIDTNIG